MHLQLLPFSSLWSSQFLRWDIFLQYGRQVGLWIMEKVGRLWGVSFQFYIVVFVSIMECKLLCLSFQCHSFLLVEFLFIRSIGGVAHSDTIHILIHIHLLYVYICSSNVYWLNSFCLRIWSDVKYWVITLKHLALITLHLSLMFQARLCWTIFHSDILNLKFYGCQLVYIS
jgi:hypothetical protein